MLVAIDGVEHGVRSDAIAHASGAGRINDAHHCSTWVASQVGTTGSTGYLRYIVV